jgi:cell division protease FtsH
MMPAHRQYSEATGRDIDCAIQQLTQAAFQRATALLAQRKALLEEGSRRLLERETLDEREVQDLVARASVKPPVAVAA